MSATSLDRGDGNASTTHLEGLVEEWSGLKAALSRGKAIRRLLLLGLLAFFVAFGWLYWQLLQRLQSESYKNELIQAASTKLNERSDEYMKEVQTLVEASSPVIADAASKQFQADIPTYLKALERESNQFAEQIKSEAESKYRQQVEAILKKHEEILTEEIPSLKDIEVRERMISNMRKALEQIGQKYAIDPIGDELAALYDKWDKFPAVPPPAPEDAPLKERVLGLSLDVVLNKLVETRRAANPGT